MADIELVIKIPEEIYKASQIIDVKYEDVIQIPLEVIKNGISLPKGHGRLVDANELIKSMDSWDKFGYSAQDGLEWLCKDDKEYVTYVHYEDMVTAVTNAPTIIEEDKE